MQAHRVSPRVAYEEAVCLTRVDGNGRVYGRGIDLGANEISVVCAEPCPVGAEVRFSVLLPAGPHKFSGRIVAVRVLERGYDVAVEFENLKPGTASALATFVGGQSQKAMAAVAAEPGDAYDPGTRATKPIARQPMEATTEATMEAKTDDTRRSTTARYGVPIVPAAPSPVAVAHAPEPPPTQLPPPYADPQPKVVVSSALVRSPGERASSRPRPRMSGTALLPRNQSAAAFNQQTISEDGVPVAMPRPQRMWTGSGGPSNGRAAVRLRTLVTERVGTLESPIPWAWRWWLGVPIAVALSTALASALIHLRR